MSPPWSIVFMGTPGCAADTLERLVEGPDPVVGVVTRPDRPAGRGYKPVPSPVRLVAEAHKRPVLTPEKIRSNEFFNDLSAWAPDLIVVVAFGRILPRSVLDLPPHGCINVHYSLLPRYRGAAPITWTLINGEQTSGVTTMRLVERMDAGPILLQETVRIAPGETPVSLEAKLTPIGVNLLLQTIQGLKQGTIQETPQREQEATYAAMLEKKDGEIDWTQPAIVIERLVRAFAPWPSAYTRWQGQLLKVHKAAVVDGKAQAQPGEVVRADDGGLWVGTGDGVLDLREVQLENRNRLPSSDFLRGARVKEGAFFQR